MNKIANLAGIFNYKILNIPAFYFLLYGKTDEKRPIESRMIQIAEHIAEDYTPDVLQDLVNVQDDSLLYGLDEYNLSLRLKETMASSIAYTLMAR